MESVIKTCSYCTTQNPSESFWCSKCGQKLTTSITLKTQPHDVSDVLINHISQTPSTYQPPKTSYKKIIAISLLSALCLISIIYLLNGNSLSFQTPSLNPINCHINEDFWFENSTLYTSDGWTFTITKVKDYTLTGIVLGLHTYQKNDYPYRPINIFSPLDLLIGIDNIQTHPDHYPIHITSFHDRAVYWTWQGTNMNNYHYLKSHSGNHHIVPQNKEVLNHLTHNITTHTQLTIIGSLVNLYGTNNHQTYTWNTDTQIGNYHCEIILVETIIIHH